MFKKLLLTTYLLSITHTSFATESVPILNNQLYLIYNAQGELVDCVEAQEQTLDNLLAELKTEELYNS